MILYEDTEQALVKEALIHTEVPMIVCRIAPFRIVYVNNVLEKEWGFYADIISEEPDRITELVDTADRTTFIEKLINHPLDACKEPIEFRMVMPDKSQKWYSLRLYPLRVYQWVVGIFEDITARKCKEMAFQARYDRLEDYVRMIRHDLKGAVGNIEIALSLIKEKIDTKQQEELVSYFDLTSLICRETVSHTEELSDRFFLTEGNLILEKSEINLAEEVLQAVDLYSAQLESKNLTLKVLLSAEKMIIQADKMKCWHILKNLISNAIKFSHEHSQIVITLKDLKDAIVLEINDSGIGIPLAFQPFIFQRHSLAIRNGTKGEKPTGLGTYIVKTMVEAHDGEAWFESEESVGTTFFVKLPK